MRQTIGTILCGGGKDVDLLTTVPKLTDIPLFFKELFISFLWQFGNLLKSGINILSA
ncbi:MAG: hypothetical protein JW743_03715 [Deltaproteobacteria bacterium]|nr:hypothetical protein [Deltaproteobacteria bacterium]MBN2846295.1 hypothetical protein [Deltaproteobacteria bacterium]